MLHTDTTETTFTNDLTHKMIIVDTSSLLVSGTALLKYLKNCHLVIPAIVISELEDNRNKSEIGWLSRQWLRLLEEFRVKVGEGLHTGVELDNGITLSVQPNHTSQQSLPTHLRNGKPDSTILAVANNLKKENEQDNVEVVVLSNDTPLRLHATLDLGMDAFEFSATSIEGVVPFSGLETVIFDSDEYARTELASQSTVDMTRYEFDEFLSKFDDELQSEYALITVKLDDETIAHKLVATPDFVVSAHEFNNNEKFFGITGRSVEQKTALGYLSENPEYLPIVSLGGSAGTGKTLLSLAVGLNQTRDGVYDKVIVLRSLHEMGEGQELGFLPGTVNDKMSAWSGAISDAMNVVTHFARSVTVEDLKNHIEVSPITYLRGRSLNNSYIILEEAQNFSRSEILNVISRAGEGSKVVLTFDAAQVDNRFLQSGKNAEVWSVIDRLKNEDLFAHITLTKTERSRVAEMAARILDE